MSEWVGTLLSCFEAGGDVTDCWVTEAVGDCVAVGCGVDRV